MDDHRLSALAVRDLDFNAPLSAPRIAEILTSLVLPDGARILDLGCGWAELLLRILAAEPTATGHGIERNPLHLDRARTNAAARGLDGRIVLQEADATAADPPPDPADLVISIGASHIWGGTRPTLERLRRYVKPGGRLLLGDVFWERPPTPEALAVFDVGPGEYGTLAELVDLAVDCGYRPFAVSAADSFEMDSWESRWCRGLERWLLDRPDADPADIQQVRNLADEHREGWLHGYRGMFGFAYLTLALPR